MEHDKYCLFHGKKHRSEFQFILNYLRTNGVNKIDFDRAASLVCCCKLDSDCKKSCQNILSGKDMSTENKFSEGDVGKPQDKDLCMEQDGTLQSVLQMNVIPGKVKVILEKWLKREPDAESHVRFGNSRVSALMMLCLKGTYKPLLKMMFNLNSRDHVVIVPIPQKLVRPFLELDMKEKCEQFGFTFEVLAAPLIGLSNCETLLKVTCDEDNIKAVETLLIKEAKDLVTKEKKSAIRLLRDLGCETISSDMEGSTESHQTVKTLKRKQNRMRMS